MNGVLSALEQDGYSFRLEHDRLIVKGAPDRITPAALDQLRHRKPEILAECRLRDFVDLVRITAACDHQVLLHRNEIARELDAADVAALGETTRAERQAWAAGIAYRLTHQRIQR